MAEPRGNLPPALSGLIGRDAAVRRVRGLLPAHRLVTLTGLGGIGKTRLALEAARGLSGDFDAGAWLAELSPLTDPALVTAAVADALGLRLGEAAPTPAAVADAIGRRRLLLVLDNCEHLLGASVVLAEAVIAACPHAAVLATSREVLGIAGERVHRVPPLGVPVSGASEGLLGHGAVRLFAERMWAIGTDPTERPEDLVAVAAICRRLDGNPLAIEFAAATACALGPQAVLEGLGARFALLTTGRRTAPLRHRTLRTALDWSHDLLPEAERRLLRRLGVMAGGVPLGAAEAVMATDAGPPPGRTAAGLAALAAKALVVTDDAAGAPRWRLLKTVRAYALERLAEAGEAEETARRHARFYRGLFAPAGCSPGIAPTLGSRAAFARELDNARAALDWAFSPPRGTWRSALL